MYLSCPSCSSTNIKKSGHTYYGKQNHQCKSCSRQFVVGSTHRKTLAQKSGIRRALQEQISLRGICRIFQMSLTWLSSLAQSEWQQTLRDLGITASISNRLSKLQIFCLQADELWSFVRNKKRKCWI